MNHLNVDDKEPVAPEAPDGTAHADASSSGGKWHWDGSRWSARHETVIGSVIPRILAWTLMGALPLGAIVSFPIGWLLWSVNSGVSVFGVSVLFVAAEALVVYVLLRQTPRITIDRGKMTIDHILGDDRGRSISVQSVTSIELARGSMAALAVTEGYLGEGRVLIHVDSGPSIELDWDAFSSRAGKLASLLGVSLTDPAAEASRQRAAALARDPSREKRNRILAYVAVIGVVILVTALLFGPLAVSIFQMLSRR